MSRDAMDDEAMDALLREAMAADAPPQLSPSFDNRLARRLRPNRLTATGRVVMAVYIAVASASAAWFMRDMPPEWVAASLAVGVSAATGAGAYARRLVSRA